MFASFHIESKWAKYHHHWNCIMKGYADFREWRVENKLKKKKITLRFQQVPSSSIFPIKKGPARKSSSSVEFRFTFCGTLRLKCLIRALVTNCHATLVVQVFDGCYPISSFQTVRNTFSHWLKIVENFRTNFGRNWLLSSLSVGK